MATSIYAQALSIVEAACTVESYSMSSDTISSDLLEHIVDAACLYDISLPADATAKQLQNLAGFLKSLAEYSSEARQMLLLAAEPRLLEACCLIESASHLTRRQIRANTTMYYRQAKFNGFGEEAEGWARLMVLLGNLSRESGSAPSDGGICSFEKALELIGTFSLDPNRVVDCVIDAARASLCFHDYGRPIDDAGLCAIGPHLRLLRSMNMPSERIAEIVGLKLLSDAVLDGYFFLVIAMLIKDGIATATDIVGYLPNDQYVSSNSLNSAINNPNTFAAKASLPSPAGAQFHCIGDSILAQIPPSADHRVLLFDACLRTGQLELAAALLNLFGALHADHPPCWLSLSFTLLKLLAAAPSLSSGAADSRCLLYWLEMASPYLFVSPQLTFRLIDRLPSIELIVRFVFPILPLLSPFPTIVYKLWDRLSGLDWKHRHALYAHLALPNPAVFKIHTQDIKRVMRRLSRENVKPIGRHLGKLSCMAPTVVSSVVIDQIKSYGNLIEPLVEALRYATPLAIDCILAALLKCIASSRTREGKIKADGVNVAGWLMRLSVLTASLLKRFCQTVELTPVIAVLKGRLLGGHGSELCCLTEVVRRMSGIEIATRTVNETQLEASFGRPVLNGLVEAELQNAGAASSTNANSPAPGGADYKRSMGRLGDALRQQDPDCALFMALAKQPCVEVFKEEYSTDELKAQSNAFDVAFEAFALYNALLVKLGCPDLVRGLPDLEGLLGAGIEKHMAHAMLRTKQTVCGVESEADSHSFHELSIQDVYVPKERYEQELAKLKSIACSANAQPRDRERSLSLLLSLEREYKQAMERVQVARERLKEQKTSAVPYLDVVARAVMTPSDAVFCAHYVLVSGAFEIKEFFWRLDVLIPAMSERESVCYGRFLSLLVTDPATQLASSDHVKLFSMLNAPLSSSHFIPIRNSILLLTRLEGVFPVHCSIAAALGERVRLLHAHDGREDVRVLATRCQALLLATAAAKEIDLQLGSDGSGDGEDGDVGELAAAFAEISSLAAAGGSNSATSPAMTPPTVSSADSTAVIEDGEHTAAAPPAIAANSHAPSSAASSRLKRAIEQVEADNDGFEGAKRARESRDVLEGDVSLNYNHHEYERRNRERDRRYRDSQSRHRSSRR